ncbi:hypothetical protein MRB53_008603 [Persea americana]|uniref:Uncharacterized protein n=1 Tax=Persea americana TaxID=3435 RepID=A0ACC2MMC1_PERAE|nr:hypothetical protein MRB53_008603 [Persea americana]
MRGWRVGEDGLVWILMSIEGNGKKSTRVAFSSIEKGLRRSTEEALGEGISSTRIDSIAEGKSTAAGRIDFAAGGRGTASGEAWSEDFVARCVCSSKKILA